MKKSLLNIVLLIATASTISAQNYSGGNGTLADPYKIANKTDLKYLSDSSNQWSYHYIQTADIIFTSTDFASGGDFYNAGKGFRPIGSSTTNFTGSYNGNNHIIDSLFINRPLQGYVGLLGLTANTVDTLISNLGCTNLNINGSGCVGGLLGRNLNSGIISNCYISGTVSGNSNDYVGGLVGYFSSGIIKNCYSVGTIGGRDQIGGLIGYNIYGNISNCFSTASVNGSSYVGGLIGKNDFGIISYCYGSGPVNGSIEYIGGLVGFNISTGVINYCYSSGTVSGYYLVGGLIGENDGAINNCYSNGSVNGSYSSVGGLAGENDGSISNSYSSGMVNGTNTDIGGLIGLNHFGSVTNSFWDTQISGQTTSAGGTGKTTIEMKTMTTFTGVTWDFSGETTNGTADIWTLGPCNTDGNSYPILTWQVFPSGGDGSLANPFIIASKQDLKTLSENSCLWNKNFVQTADISFTPSDFTSGGAFYNGGQAFRSIGNSSTQFTGSYNGQNHKIENLRINGSSYAGLFGHCYNASLINLEVMNISVNSNYASAGLCGYCISSNIITCSTSGDITSGYSSAGLVANSSSNTISNCYSLANVSIVVLRMEQNNGVENTTDIFGTSGTGGLIGSCASSTITNCYAAGNVNTTFGQGGLIGVGGGNTVINSFWDIQSTGQNISAGGTGKPTNEMKSDSTYLNHAWDFVAETTNGSVDIWQMNCVTNYGYPVFSWQTLNLNSSLSVSSSLANVTCNGGSDGSIDLTTTGGNSPYTYSWSNAATTEDITGLTVGNYTVTITDVNMCTGTQTVTITEPTPLTSSFTSNDEISGNDGTIDLTVSGGTTSYTYSWTGPNSFTSSSEDLTGLGAGIYNLTITDANNCSITNQVTVGSQVGLKHITSASTKIYPNPSTGVFMIDGLEKETTLEVIDVIGQVVYTTKTNDGKTNIDLSNQANGVYYLKTNSGLIQKLIKQD